MNSLRTYVIFGLIGLLTFSGACSKNPVEGGSATVTTTTGTATGVTGVVVNPPQTDAFHITNSATVGTNMVLHTEGDWTQPCRILQTDSPTDMFCVLEVNELDLWYNGITMNYNIPASMCNYSRVYYPYFYQYEPVIGYTAVTVTVSASGVASVTSHSGGSSNASIASLSDTTPICNGNYGAIAADPTIPNCCEGSYVLTVIDNSASPPTATSSTNSWGGDHSTCLKGPGMDIHAKTKDGYPRPSSTYLNGQNLNGSQTFNRPIQMEQASVAYLANYFTGTGTPITYPFSSAPKAFKGPGGAISSTQPWYEYDCLDHNFDYLHRIRVLVRSWSRGSEFAAQGNDSDFGPEGVPFSDQDYFDFQGWVGNGFGNTYPAGAL